MKTVKNEKLIERNSKIGQYTSIGAIVVLGIGMFISFKRPDLFAYSLISLVMGFTMTQVGMYFSNRWGRPPRPFEQLDIALKGLPGEFTLYHYSTPASHLLVGPAGIWVLMPYRQRGKVIYEKNRWKVKGGGFMQSYMSIFGQEGIGRPELEIKHEMDAVKKLLDQNMEGAEVPEIQGLVIFTHEGVEIEANDSPIPAIPIKKLKDFMRQKAKERPLGNTSLLSVKSTLPEG